MTISKGFNEKLEKTIQKQTKIIHGYWNATIEDDCLMDGNGNEGKMALGNTNDRDILIRRNATASGVQHSTSAQKSRKET